VAQDGEWVTRVDALDVRGDDKAVAVGEARAELGRPQNGPATVNSVRGDDGAEPVLAADGADSYPVLEQCTGVVIGAEVEDLSTCEKGMIEEEGLVVIVRGDLVVAALSGSRIRNHLNVSSWHFFRRKKRGSF
jgi:hypothetical protein